MLILTIDQDKSKTVGQFKSFEYFAIELRTKRFCKIDRIEV